MNVYLYVKRRGAKLPIIVLEKFGRSIIQGFSIDAVKLVIFIRNTKIRGIYRQICILLAVSGVEKLRKYKIDKVLKDTLSKPSFM